MLFKITYTQIKIFLLTSLSLLAIWLFMGHYAAFRVNQNGMEGKVTVNVSFLAPMNWQKTLQRISITGEITGRKVIYSARRISRNTMQITIDESGYPRGLEYTIRFRKAPALIPPFTVSAQKKIRLRLAPEVIALSQTSNVSTTGPLVLVFNTPVDPDSFIKHVSTDAPGNFTPLVSGSGGESRCDYSRWALTPLKRFKNNTAYNITVASGLAGKGGRMAAKRAQFTFTTAPALVITDVYPHPSGPSVWLNRCITISANQKLEKADIRVAGIGGKVEIKEKTAVFDPDELFLPSREYRVSVDLVSEYGERLHKEFSFGTTNLGSLRWIEIKVGNPCSLQVYEGNRLIKSFQGWLSIPPDRVPRVTMYETKRGSTQEFNPEDPSPLKYIKLNADIMLHQMRTGEADNHNLAGLPPSYGCILLNRPDMDWIVDNVPEKCMVIVH